MKYYFGRSKKNVADLDFVLIMHNPKVLYVETPKAACTKIRNLLILLNQGCENHELANFLRTIKQAPSYHWEYGLTDNRSISNSELSSLFQNSDYLKFTFVRNPYDRLVSAYINKMCNAHLENNAHFTYVAKKIKAQAISSSSGLIADAIARMLTQINTLIVENRKSDSVVKRKSYYQGYDKDRDHKAKSSRDDAQKSNYDYDQIQAAIERDYGSTLPGFAIERLINRIRFSLVGCPNFEAIDLSKTPVHFEEFIEYVCQQNDEALEVQWRPQTLVTGFDIVDYDFVGKVETFDRDIKCLFKKIGANDYMYKYIPGRINTTKKGKKQIFWTDTLADMVYHKYQVDFENFGYDRFAYREF